MLYGRCAHGTWEFFRLLGFQASPPLVSPISSAASCYPAESPKKKKKAANPPPAAAPCCPLPTPPRVAPTPASPPPLSRRRPRRSPTPASPPPPAAAFPVELRRRRQIGFWMAGSEDMKGLAASLGELHVEASPSREREITRHGNGADVAADDDIWDDASDSPGHGSTLDREWAYRQNQFHKMGYRDGITEGQKDAAQEGFNVGFRQSVHVGYKWGLVRGITSALASRPDSLKEKLLPDVQCRGKLLDLHNSVQSISAEDALQMFHESILQNNHLPEELHVTSEADTAADLCRLQTLPKDLVLLLHECPDIKVREELARDS